jgi:hypothetical protein
VSAIPAASLASFPGLSEAGGLRLPQVRWRETSRRCSGLHHSGPGPRGSPHGLGDVGDGGEAKTGSIGGFALHSSTVGCDAATGELSVHAGQEPRCRGLGYHEHPRVSRLREALDERDVTVGTQSSIARGGVTRFRPLRLLSLQARGPMVVSEGCSWSMFGARWCWRRLNTDRSSPPPSWSSPTCTKAR